jgi:hypothetical protein
MDKDYLILKRAATLASIVAKTSPGIRFNEHMEGDGPTVFAHACRAYALWAVCAGRSVRNL